MANALDILYEIYRPLSLVPAIDVRNFPIISHHWPEVAAIFTPLYLGLVFIVPRLMKRFNIGPFELTLPMMLWNLSLSVVSLCMFVGIVVPTFASALASPRGIWYHLVTLDAEYSAPTWVGPHIFWMWLFGLSKVVELGDTVFLVLRRKEVPFLHWYHHATVLSFTWFAMWALAGPGFMFAIMNSFVHVVMYFYYFLTGLGYRPFFGKYITQLQMLQMIMGVTCSVCWTYYTLTIGTRMYKYYPYWFIGASTLMYASYFYLFLQFYLNRYNQGQRDAAAAKRQAATAAAASSSKQKAN